MKKKCTICHERRKHRKTHLMGVKDDLSDTENFQLILNRRHSLDVPRIWRKKNWPEDKK